MRFMVIVKATKDSEAGKMPSEELLSAMAKFNEEMVKAGVMLDGNGLQPSSKGARVRFSGDKRRVIDGPFKELVAGYWILECKSLAERSSGSSAAPTPITRIATSRSGNCSSWTTSAPARLSSTIAGWANRLPRSTSALVVVIRGCLGRSLCEASGRTSPFPR
jgi:hypothetical protein